MNSNPFEFLEKQFNKITQQEKIAFFTTFITGFICHLFMLTNKIPNHDELRTYSVYGGTVISGRPFVKVPDYISGYFGLPSKEGLISIIYISLICAIICNLFKIRNKIICGLIGVALVTFPTVASCMGYMYMSDVFFFSTMISFLAVLLAEKFINSKKSVKIFFLILNSVLLALGLCMYQSGYMFAVGLITMLFIINEIDYNSNGTWDIKNFLKRAIYYMLLLGLALVFYYLFVNISLAVTGLSLTSRKGIDSAGIETILNLPNRIIEAYSQFIWYFFKRKSQTVLSIVLPIITGVLSLIGLYFIFVLAFEKKIFSNFVRGIIFILLLLCIPIAVEFVYIIVQDSTDIKYHMAYGIVLWYVFILVIFDRIDILDKTLDKKNKRVLSMWVVLCCTVLIQWDNWLYTSNAYNAGYFTYEQTYSYFSNMVQRIEETEGFSYETPIAIIGGIGESEKPATLPRLRAFTSQYADKTHPTVSLPGELVLISTYAHPYFIKHFLGYDLTFASDEQENMVIATEEFKNMPCYPKDGSVKNIDGIIVVKQRNVD